MGKYSHFGELASRAMLEGMSLRLVYLLLFATFGATTAALILTHPDPAGPNGYFYLKNIQELSAFRGFYFHDYSLAFLFPAFLNIFLHDPLTSWAIAVSFTLAAIPFLVAAIAEETSGRKSSALPFFLLLYFASQYPLIELGLTFFKNAFALMLAFASLACFARYRKPIPAFALGFCSLLSHKTMLLWLAAMAVIFFPEKFRASKKLLITSIAAAGVLLIVSFTYLHLFQQGKASLNLDADPEPFYFWVRHNLQFEPAFTWPLFLALASWCWLGFSAIRNKRQWISFAIYSFVLILDLHPWQEPGSAGLHYRLWLLLPAVPLVVVAKLFLKGGIAQRLTITALACAALYWVYPNMKENFAIDFDNYSVLATDVKRIPEFVKPGELLVCKHGLEFYVDYVTGIRCRSFVDRAKTESTWRVAYLGDVSSRAALEDLNRHSPLKIGERYALFRETYWVKSAERHGIKPNDSNPAQERPAFIHNQE